ncbi:DNA polymerase I, partial [Klebsiella pneumoniae]|nr:DNA polymerase I [Klebsiella pneumoniae]
NCIRGALQAAPDHKLIASDLSNIEGRMLAWLAGEQWKLDAFANGDDLYILGYAAAFGMDVADVEADEKAGGVMRLIGKVMELALGY